jgi:hypothetical protein
MGLSPDVTAAFVLLKRAKELVWIGVGYGLLAALRRPESAQGATSQPDGAIGRLLPSDA